MRKTKTTRATCVRKNVKDAKYVLSVGRGRGVWEGSGGGGGVYRGPPAFNSLTAWWSCATFSFTSSVREPDFLRCRLTCGSCAHYSVDSLCRCTVYRWGSRASVSLTGAADTGWCQRVRGLLRKQKEKSEGNGVLFWKPGFLARLTLSLAGPTQCELQCSPGVWSNIWCVLVRVTLRWAAKHVSHSGSEQSRHQTMQLGKPQLQLWRQQETFRWKRVQWRLMAGTLHGTSRSIYLFTQVTVGVLGFPCNFHINKTVLLSFGRNMSKSHHPLSITNSPFSISVCIFKPDPKGNTPINVFKPQWRVF